MQDILNTSLRVLKKTRKRRVRFVAIVLILSLFVSLDVFWVLRQPGLTLAGDADCGMVEHTHDAACGMDVLICQIPDTAHVHTEACYELILSPPLENTVQICQIPEEPHIHNEDCYQTVVTTDTESILICQDQDTEHTHVEDCYTRSEITLEESVLICEVSTEPHQHTEECFVLELTEESSVQVLVCDADETAHVHGEGCYQWQITCDMTEHVHSISCYSDDTANVETMLDWQEMFASYPYTGNLREDLVGIAKTQVGYSESSLNFEIGNDGIRRGYTRYGAWYGFPYGNWDATFVSFCLFYAGADGDQMPINIGASTMMREWDAVGRYVSAGDYSPVSGDLVFFKDTVGIVSEVQSSSVYVIYGDAEDKVVAELLVITDPSIQGWGITDETLPDQEEDPPDETEYSEITESKLLDISEGPAVFIFEGGMSLFSLRRSAALTQSSPVDIATYLAYNGGDYFFTLVDMNNQPVPTDDAGNYIVAPNTQYKLTISFYSPYGLHPGVYEYKIMDGAKVEGGEGNFVLSDGALVGDWTLTDDGLLTFNFNDEMASRTEITISTTMGIYFPQDGTIDFDGKISITVQKPADEEHPTSVIKWGMQGNDSTSGKTDDTKIYWNVNIVGNSDSDIVGSVITDIPLEGEWMGSHRYIQSDMDAGLKFGASDPNGGWHAWTVYPGDPNLTWTEVGWSYTMPDTVTCPWCGELALGNEGWIYYIDYSSTPYVTSAAGSLYYMNRITVDGQVAEGGVGFTQGEMLGELSKTGSFVSDASGGFFLWEIQAQIPGMQTGQKAEYNWFIMDYMYITNADGIREAPVHNDADLVTVTATYNDNTIVVPNIRDATADDPFAWDNAWSPNINGVKYGRQLGLLCRCNCNADTCQFSGTGCSEYWFERDDGTWATAGFCQCWAVPDNVLFTFVYKTTDVSLIENYGGIGYQLQNLAELYYIPSGSSDGTMVSQSQVLEPIPGVFDKALTHDFDGYTAHYRVTVNEAKLNLTNGSPLTIKDEMTQTLAYISGSLVMTTEDANGNIDILTQGVDYTLTYDGTGSQTDQYGNPVHTLDIVILHPQPVMYILDYDTTLIIPPGTNQAIKYSNSARITLWGEDIGNIPVEKIFADINIAAKTYKMEMLKTCAETGEPLAGAEFGFYNAQGGLITTETTDANGKLSIQTNIVNGIIIRDHVLYYLQELKAPTGYLLDDTPLWICFCDHDSDQCADCDRIMEGLDAVRVRYNEEVPITITNEIMDYDLPSTGGPGVYPLILVGVAFIVTPLVYMFILRRKREWRSYG